MERLVFGWDFEVDAWSKFWNLIKICVWTCNMTLARWTQPSGPLCLWQCLTLPIDNAMLSHIFKGFHSFGPYKYNCKYCFALNLVKAIIFQSKLTICQQAVFNSFPTQFKRQKMKCSLRIDSSQSIHIKNPSATNHPKTTQPNVSISFAYSHLDSTLDFISWEWVEELTYSIQFPKRENLNIYMVS